MTDTAISDQFASMWRFFLSRPHTQSWLCDATPVPLSHAVSHAREPPCLLATHTEGNGRAALHTLCVLGHDGPFALGALVAGGVRELTLPRPLDVARSALVQPPNADAQVMAAFSWLAGGALVVRFGVVTRTAKPVAADKACRWDFSRVYEPAAAAAVARAAARGPEYALADGIIAPPNAYRDVVTPTQNRPRCPSCTSRGYSVCQCHTGQSSPRPNTIPTSTVGSAPYPAPAPSDRTPPTGPAPAATDTMHGNVFQSAPQQEGLRNTNLGQDFGRPSYAAEQPQIFISDEMWKSQEPALPKICSQIDAALSFSELPSAPTPQSGPSDAPIPAEQIFSPSGPLSSDADQLLTILNSSSKPTDTPVSVKDFPFPNGELPNGLSRKLGPEPRDGAGPPYGGAGRLHGRFATRLPPAAPIKKPRVVQTLECPQCGAQIRGKRGNLNRHIAARHDRARAFACAMPRCGLAFQSKLNLVRHMTRVHEGRPHRCAQCPRGFRSAGTLAKHVRAAHAPRRAFVCDKCAVCFGRRSVLDNHVARVHGGKAAAEEPQKNFTCAAPDCDSSFAEWTEMQTHEREAHAGRVHQCTGCVSVFETECALSRHIRTEHGQTKTSRNCPVCGCVYSQRSNLLRHMSLAHKNYMWEDEYE